MGRLRKERKDRGQKQSRVRKQISLAVSLMDCNSTRWPGTWEKAFQIIQNDFTINCGWEIAVSKFLVLPQTSDGKAWGGERKIGGKTGCCCCCFPPPQRHLEKNCGEMGGFQFSPFPPPQAFPSLLAQASITEGLHLDKARHDRLLMSLD